MTANCIAILDDEERYASHLSGSLIRDPRLPYRVACFSSEKRLQKHRLSDIRLLIVAESEYTESVRQLSFPAVLLLNESGVSPTEEVPQISKYRTTEEITTCILKILLSGEGDETKGIRHSGRMRRIGVYSPLSHCLQTTFTLCMGQILSRTGRVLYLNFEPFSGLSIFLEKTFRGSVSDLLYYNACAKKKVAGQLAMITETVGGLDFIPPMKSFPEMHAISAQEWVSLFQTMEEVTEYDTLLLDLSEGVDGLFSLLRECDVVYTICRTDRLSHAKMTQYEELLKAMEYQDVFTKSKRLTLPTFKQVTLDTEELTKGDLANYIRRLLHEDAR